MSDEFRHLPEIEPSDLADYVDGLSTSEMSGRIERSMAAEAGAEAMVNALRVSRQVLGQDLLEAEPWAKEIASTVLQRVVINQVPSERALSTHTAHRQALVSRGSRMWRMGIACAAVVAVAVLLRNLPHNTSSSRALRAYATTTGQRASVTLDDGSTALLAPRTTLRITQLSAATRRMTLEGEAYFRVANSRGIPFEVQTGAITTRVLGTEFTVHHYADDRYVRVAVATGRVAIRTSPARHASLILDAGRVGEATDSTATLVSGVSATDYTAWTTGMLVFHRAPVRDVLTALTRWYGYTFQVTDSALTQRTLTAGISTQSSQEALATLKLLLNVEMTFDNGTVTLKPRGPRPTPSVPERQDRQHMTTLTSEAGR